MIGHTLAHYTVTAKIGEGGMGEVYRAQDAKLDRDVALKVLPAAVATDPTRLRRFQREAKAVAALSHPNIVTIYSVEEVDGIHPLTMELVDGQGLDARIPPDGLPLAQVLDIGMAPRNFAPCSTLPTLMINGKNDFNAPVETNIRPMFEMLGTPDASKRLVLLDGGHVPNSVNDFDSRDSELARPLPGPGWEA